jgi:hypothetical protein
MTIKIIIEFWIRLLLNFKFNDNFYYHVKKCVLESMKLKTNLTFLLLGPNEGIFQRSGTLRGIFQTVNSEARFGKHFLGVTFFLNINKM